MPPWRSPPVAVAVSVTPPLSTSAWVTTYGAFSVHVSVSPGASPGAGGVGQSTAPAVGSDTDSDVRSTLPVFVITYEYWIVSPAWSGAELPSDAFSTFCSSSDGVAATVGTVSSTTASTAAR